MEGNVRRRKLFGPVPKAGKPEGKLPEATGRKPRPPFKPRTRNIAVMDFLGMLGALSYLAWLVFNSHSIKLPEAKEYLAPLTEFSEARALRAMMEITGLGSHEFGSMTLDYVTSATRRLLDTMKRLEVPHVPGVDLEVEVQEAHSGWVDVRGGMAHGRTVVYDSLQNLLCRISPKGNPKAKENALLISTHLDGTKFSVGAGDSSSSAAVMVELVRNVMHEAQSMQNAVIFLWNTGEEEGLMGAHAFITQHPWARTVRAMVDLEAIGSGGKSTLF